MQDDRLQLWKHAHTFGQDQKRPGESRTLIVIAITFVMMVIEIVAGIIYGSMALLADGLHMASHTVALGISAFAYIYARKHASDERYSFGTGKVNTLGGYTGAILLAGFSLLMIWESAERFFAPVAISYNPAILVAVLGLVVNGVCVLILGVHSHAHEEGETIHLGLATANHDHDHDQTEHHNHAHHQDHNLVSAYLHVLADALTSLLAIIALLAAKYFGLVWMDPLMGLIGAALVARWSWGLLRSTSAILLDRQGPAATRQSIVNSIERGGDCHIVDLHLWAVGPDIYSALISLVSHDPQTPQHYKDRLPRSLVLDHVTVEVHHYDLHAKQAMDSHHHA